MIQRDLGDGTYASYDEEVSPPVPVKPFTGPVDEYVTALHEHNGDCEACAPGGGLPRTNDDPRLCETGRKIRTGLSYARGRAAGRTGAKL